MRAMNDNYLGAVLVASWTPQVRRFIELKLRTAGYDVLLYDVDCKAFPDMSGKPVALLISEVGSDGAFDGIEFAKSFLKKTKTRVMFVAGFSATKLEGGRLLPSFHLKDISSEVGRWLQSGS